MYVGFKTYVCICVKSTTVALVVEPYGYTMNSTVVSINYEEIMQEFYSFRHLQTRNSFEKLGPDNLNNCLVYCIDYNARHCEHL